MNEWMNGWKGFVLFCACLLYLDVTYGGVGLVWCCVLVMRSEGGGAREEEGDGRIGGYHRLDYQYGTALAVVKSGPPWLVGYDGTI